jgi:hypothetical protein
MGIVQKLGSRERVLTLVRHTLGESALRDLATRYHVTIPGFRTREAPLNLLARSIAHQSRENIELARGIEERLDELAAAARGFVSRRDPPDVAAELGRLESMSRRRAVELLAAALTDVRDAVVDAGLKVVDELQKGSIRLPSRTPEDERRRPERSPAGGFGPPRGSDYRQLSRVRELERALAGREQELRALRSESTRQEQKLARLREQLEAERETHARTRAERDALRAAPGARGSNGAKEAAELRVEVQRLQADVRRSKAELDGMRSDYALLVEGVRELGEITMRVLERAGDASTNIRPRKPTRTSARSADEKVRLPVREDHWPRHLRAFLERLGASEYVEQIRILGFFGSGSTRVLHEIPDSTLLAQFSDGERAARFLITTTGSSPAALLWVRRHLTEQYFPAP